MADTQKSLSDLLTDHADNTSRSISPAKNRHVIVSALGSYTELAVTAGATAQTSLSSTPAKMTGWDTDGVTPSAAGAPTPDSTTDDDITVGVAGNYLVWLSICGTGSASETFTFTIQKNGSDTTIKLIMPTNATPDAIAGSMIGILTCAASDLLTVTIATVGSSKSFTPTECRFGIKQIG